MPSEDINTVLSRVTPEKSLALVEAWLVHQAIPDISTLKFIGALLDLDFEIVRYWFYCRSNRDGIKRAFAESAKKTSSSSLSAGGGPGIVLPPLDEYYLLDKFSEGLECDFLSPPRSRSHQSRPQEQEHEQEQEPTHSSISVAQQRASHTEQQQQKQRRGSNSVSVEQQRTPHTQQQQQKQRRESNTASVEQQQQQQRRGSTTAAVTPHANLLKASRSTTTTSKDAPEPSKDVLKLFDDVIEQDEDHVSLGSVSIHIGGDRGKKSSGVSGGLPKTVRSTKTPALEVGGEPVKKRGRPLGSFKKKPRLGPIDDHPPATHPPLTAESPSTEESLLAAGSSLTTEPLPHSAPTRYFKPVVLLPFVASWTPSTAGITAEPAPKESESTLILYHSENGMNDVSISAPTPIVLTTGMAGDPVAGEASRRKFLEEQHSMEQRERRARSRARSQVRARGRITAQSKAPRTTRTKPGGTHDRSKSPKLGRSQRRVIHLSDDDDDENYTANNDTGDDGVNQEPPPPSNSGGDGNKRGKPRGSVLGSTQAFYKEFALIKAKRREKQPAQDEASVFKAYPERVDPSASATLPQQKTPTPLSSEAPQWTSQHPLPPKLATSYFSPFPESVYGLQGSLKPYMGHTNAPAEDVDPGVLELERVASRQRDMERRRKEEKGYGGYDYDDDPLDTSDKGRSRWDYDEYEKPREVSRGRSHSRRPLNFRRESHFQVVNRSKSPPRRYDGYWQGTDNHADEIPSPHSQSQRRYSLDGSRMPYSPENSHLPSTFPMHAPSPKSPPHQQHRSQSSHHPLDDRRRPSQIASPERSRPHHDNRRQLIRVYNLAMDMSQVPTAPASYFAKGNGDAGTHNSTKVKERPHQGSPSAEGFRPQVIKMEAAYTSPPPPLRQPLLKPTHPYSPGSSPSPPRPSDPYSPPSTLGTSFSGTTSRDRNQNQDLTAHQVDVPVAEPEPLSRTESGRSVRRLREDDGDRSGGHGRSKSRHSHHKRRQLDENTDPVSNRGRQGSSRSSRHEREDDRLCHHGDNGDRGSHDSHLQSRHRTREKRRLEDGDQTREAHPRSGDSHRSKDKNRRSSRARSTYRRSSPNGASLGQEDSRGRGRRQRDSSRDRRGQDDRSSATKTTGSGSTRDGKNEGAKLEERVEWYNRREQVRDYYD
ncbi:hypothetical protein BGX23_003685 [Mortierella sp. AD031]|nr:hypothetical protein BGX23_003685 [Mortierella sp. AD031]